MVESNLLKFVFHQLSGLRSGVLQRRADGPGGRLRPGPRLPRPRQLQRLPLRQILREIVRKAINSP